MQETVALVDQAISLKQQVHHVVINAGKVVAMQEDKSLYDSVVTCDLINADGQAIVWAMRFLGQQIPERVAGIDLMNNLLRLAADKGYRCFFFGARQEIVTRLVQKVGEIHSPAIIAGYRNGYYGPTDESSIAREIAGSGADILFVAISSPRKEEFLAKYREVLRPVSLIMGVGGSFDVLAGLTRRAPLWMQNAGLEWAYRLIQEPGRMWKRYLIGNTKFIMMVMKEKLLKRPAYRR